MVPKIKTEINNSLIDSQNFYFAFHCSVELLPF